MPNPALYNPITGQTATPDGTVPGQNPATYVPPAPTGQNPAAYVPPPPQSSATQGNWNDSWSAPAPVTPAPAKPVPSKPQGLQGAISPYVNKFGGYAKQFGNWLENQFTSPFKNPQPTTEERATDWLLNRTPAEDAAEQQQTIKAAKYGAFVAKDAGVGLLGMAKGAADMAGDVLGIGEGSGAALRSKALTSWSTAHPNATDEQYRDALSSIDSDPRLNGKSYAEQLKDIPRGIVQSFANYAANKQSANPLPDIVNGLVQDIGSLGVPTGVNSVTGERSSMGEPSAKDWNDLGNKYGKALEALTQEGVSHPGQFGALAGTSAEGGMDFPALAEHAYTHVGAVKDLASNGIQQLAANHYYANKFDPSAPLATPDDVGAALRHAQPALGVKGQIAGALITKARQDQWAEENPGVDPNSFVPTHIAAIQKLINEPGISQEGETTKGAASFVAGNRATIGLGPTADLTTAVHELFHTFRPTMSALDLTTLARSNGIDPADFNKPLANPARVAAEEALARGFERQFYDGSTLPKALKPVFAHLHSEFQRVYNANPVDAADIANPVYGSTNVRSAYNRFLGGDGRVAPGQTPGPAFYAPQQNAGVQSPGSTPTPAQEQATEQATGFPSKPYKPSPRQMPESLLQTSRGDNGLQDDANSYNDSIGLPHMDKNPAYLPVDARAKEVADAYESMPHNPSDPKVAASYNALRNQIHNQWQYATQKMGMKFEPWTEEGQPYANSKEMMADVRNNRHLYFFRGGEMPADHPLAATDPTNGLTYNDELRAIHDLFGHAVNGYEFGPRGEENAWVKHSQMFTPEATPALTTETKGQNSWVNYGPHLRDESGNIPNKGEPGYIAPSSRPFAEQKAGLLPDRFVRRPESLLQTAQPVRANVTEDSTVNGTGLDTRDFFANVTSGGANGKWNPQKPYEPLIPLRPAEASFRDVRNKYRGLFDNHIATSIPGYDEVQNIVGSAIAKTYGSQSGGADVLDIGGSEGSTAKAITALTAGRVRTVNLDPNPPMLETSNRTGVPKGYSFDLSAFSSKNDEGKPLWDDAHTNGQPVSIKGFNPNGRKFDVVHEAMTFQFIDRGRNAQVARVKDFMKPGGVALFEQKFLDKKSTFDANEDYKDQNWKSKYYTPDQIQAKRDEVMQKGGDEIAGMHTAQATWWEMEHVLAKHFKNVVQFWDSGNFKGYAASDDPAKLQKIVSNMQSTHSDFATKPTPRWIARNGSIVEQAAIPEGEIKGGLKQSSYDVQRIFKSQPGVGSPDKPGVGVEPTRIHGLEPGFRIVVPKSYNFDPALRITATSNGDASATANQYNRISSILSKHPGMINSPSEWAKGMADAYGSGEVPVPPYALIKELKGDASEASSNLDWLSPKQLNEADKGINAAKAMKSAYVSGKISPVGTGRLLMWAKLSGQMTPYEHEAAFINAFQGSRPFIEKALEGHFDNQDKREFKEWADKALPEGLPGRMAIVNLNAFADTLQKLSKTHQDGLFHRSGLQAVHDLLSDPNMTGQKFRREFMKVGEGSGIGNKMASFLALVTGHTDVTVLDRVQINRMWNDGRFGDTNLYEEQLKNGYPSRRSSLAEIGNGKRGLLIYEAIERAISKKIGQIYSNAGRPEDASVGRYHWETWVNHSEQEAQHSSLGAIASDDVSGVYAKDGKYGSFRYGSEFRHGADGPYYDYVTPSGTRYSFAPSAFDDFIRELKTPGNVYSGRIKLGENNNEPWYDQAGVNREKIELLAQHYADRGRPGGAGAVPKSNGAETSNVTGSGQLRQASHDPDFVKEMSEGLVKNLGRANHVTAKHFILPDGTLTGPFNTMFPSMHEQEAYHAVSDATRQKLAARALSSPDYEPYINALENGFVRVANERKALAITHGENITPEAARTALRVAGEHTGDIAHDVLYRSPRRENSSFEEMLDDPAIKRVLRQTGHEPAPTFYSHAQRVIESKMGGRMPADQLEKTLFANGVKSDEMKWGGLDDLINARRGGAPITKQEAIDTLKQHDLGLTEVHKGDSPRVTQSMIDRAERSGDWGEHQRLTELQENQQLGRNGETKFDQYQLPGGKNYREMLLTLPVNSADLKMPPGYRVEQMPSGKWGVYRPDIPNSIAMTSPTREDAILRARRFAGWTDNGNEGVSSANPNTYKSSHWDEPNVLAHIRMNDRVGPNGEKVLHVEEVQSDWGQAKRKGKDVPDLPFSRNWHELALKRVLRYAAENGYDRVSWTGGEDQSDRYSLGHAIDKLRYERRTPKFSSLAHELGENIYGLHLIRRDENYRNDEYILPESNDLHSVPESKLSDYVGSDIAKRIIQGESKGELAGDNLRLSSPGMKGFYDKIIPDYLNKYGKKWGAKVENTQIGPKNTTPWSVIDSGRVYLASFTTKARAEGYIAKIKSNGSSFDYHVVEEPGANGKTVQSIPITDSMRKSVMQEGQPLFQKSRADLDGHAPEFYSQSRKVVDEKAPNRFSADQLEGLLSPSNGVKPDELKWNGLQDLIDAKKASGEKLTKQEALDHIDANTPNVKIVKLGAEPGYIEAREHTRRLSIKALDYFNRLHNRVISELGSSAAADKALGEALDAKEDYDRIDPNKLPKLSSEAIELVHKYNESYQERIKVVEEMPPAPEDAKFENYKMDGGENYREHLLTLPRKGMSIADAENQYAETYLRLLEKYGYGLVRKDIMSDEDYEALTKADRDRENAYAAPEPFQSSHWHQPNVLAHTRMTDRESVAGEKLLHLEEIQSDWANKLREYGHIDREKPFVVYQDDDIANAERFKTRAEAEAYEAQYPDDALTIEDTRESGVPQAPFLKNWHELALRHALHEAVKGGYDRLSWTPGEVHADRYDFATPLSRLSYTPSDGTLTATGVYAGDVSPHEKIPANKLAEYVGKDVAQALLDPKNKDSAKSRSAGTDVMSLSHQGLKLMTSEGRGKTALYDKMIPEYLNRYGKKWGAKVDPTQIKVPVSKYDGPNHTIENVQKLNDAAQAHGPNQFINPLDGTKHHYAINRVAISNWTKDILQAMKDGISFKDAMHTYGNQEIAGLFGGAFKDVAEGKTVQSIPITDSMRKSVEENGQTLFQKSGRNPQEDTPEFRNWFKGSKVVDAQGKPLVVYHGDNPGKTTFTGYERPSNIGGNIFFSDEPNVARGYTPRKHATNSYLSSKDMSADTHGLYRTYVSIKKPLTVNAKGSDWSSVPFEGGKIQIDDLAALAKNRGYDGLIVKNVDDQWGHGNQYVAFDPTQIKSAIGNNGAFDPNDPNILHQLSKSPNNALHDKAVDDLKARSVHTGDAASTIDDIEKNPYTSARNGHASLFLDRDGNFYNVGSHGHAQAAHGILSKNNELESQLNGNFADNQLQRKTGIMRTQIYSTQAGGFKDGVGADVSLDNAPTMEQVRALDHAQKLSGGPLWWTASSRDRDVQSSGIGVPSLLATIEHHGVDPSIVSLAQPSLGHKDGIPLSDGDVATVNMPESPAKLLKQQSRPNPFRNGRYRATYALNKSAGDAINNVAGANEEAHAYAAFAARNVLSGLSKQEQEQLMALALDNRARSFEDAGTPYNQSAIPKLTDRERQEIDNNPRIQAAILKHQSGPQAFIEATREFLHPNMSKTGTPDNFFMSLVATKDSRGNDIEPTADTTRPGGALGSAQRVKSSRFATQQATGSAAEYSRDYADILKKSAIDVVGKARVKALYKTLLAQRDSAGNKLAYSDAFGQQIPSKITFNGVDYPTKIVEYRVGRLPNGGQRVMKIGVPDPIAKDIDDVTKNPPKLTDATSLLDKAQGLSTELQLSTPAEITRHVARMTSVLSALPPVGQTSVGQRFVESLPLPLGYAPGVGMITPAKIGTLYRMFNLDMNDPINQNVMLDVMKANAGSSRPFQEQVHVADGLAGWIGQKMPAAGSSMLKANHFTHDFLFSLPEGKGLKGFDLRLRVMAEKIRRTVEGNDDPQRVREFANQFGQYTHKPDGLIEAMKKINPFAATTAPVQLTEAKQLFGDAGFSGLHPKDQAALRAETLFRGAAGSILGAMLLNHALSGHWNWQNAPGHEQDIELGKDKDGKPIYFSGSAAMPNVARPIRNSGLADVITDLHSMAKDSVSKKTNAIGSDLERAAGNEVGTLLNSPLLKFGATAAWGVDPTYFTKGGGPAQVAERATKTNGESQPVNNIVSAFAGLNPISTRITNTHNTGYDAPINTPPYNYIQQTEPFLGNMLKKDGPTRFSTRESDNLSKNHLTILRQSVSNGIAKDTAEDMARSFVQKGLLTPGDFEQFMRQSTPLPTYEVSLERLPVDEALTTYAGLTPGQQAQSKELMVRKVYHGLMDGGAAAARSRVQRAKSLGIF